MTVSGEDLFVKLRDLEQRVRRGFSGFNFMLTGLSSRVENMESSQKDATKKIDDVEKDVSDLAVRLAKLEGHQEGVRDGREDTARTFAEVKEVRKEHHEEKKLGLEWWKTTAPIIIALVTGVFGLIAGVVALLQSILGLGH
jgi:predicted  nucleic acid-binding Zn-ribbon protein